jgi:hypothetical protein
MRKRSWKYWTTIAVFVGAAIFLLPGIIAFVATIVFLDEDGFIIESAPPSTPAVAESVQPPETPPLLPAGSLEDVDFSSYSTELAAAFSLELGETRLDSIDKIRLYFSPETGTNMVNMTSSTFEREDGSVMIFARNNIPDDSIFSEEIYTVFSGPKADKFNQKLAAYGLRQKCRRGDKAEEWTTELCP